MKPPERQALDRDFVTSDTEWALSRRITVGTFLGETFVLNFRHA
jgi:hypothetical protein